MRSLIVSLIAPSLWGFVAVVAGLVMLAFVRTRRAGRWVLAGGAAWLVLLSLGLPFDPIGRTIEGRFPAVGDPAELVGDGPIEWIVVLGGGHRASPRLPLSAHLPEQAVYRLIEGVRLQTALPGSRLLLVGYGGPDRVSAAEVGAALAEALGVGREALVVDGRPRTTAEEAALVAERVGEEPVVLVTSALHLPRAVRLFEREGVTVIPAPTGHAAPGRHSVRDWIIPSPARLAYADVVMREVVAGLASR